MHKATSKVQKKKDRMYICVQIKHNIQPWEGLEGLVDLPDLGWIPG